MFCSNRWSRAKTMGAALGLLTLALLLGPIAPAWTSPLQHPDRQTMPLTPPATWTPVVQGGEIEATPDPRPTAVPTRESGEGGSSNGGSGGSLGGGQTEAKPVAWLELTSDSQQVAPDQEIAVQALWANLGDGALDAATVQVALPGNLELGAFEASQGQVTQGSPGTLNWSAPTLAPGQEAILTIALRTPEGLWPGTLMLVQAQAIASGADILDAELPLTAPAAILPLAGRS